MNMMRIAVVFAGLAVASPAAYAGDAVADQPAAGSSLLDRLFPTSHPVPQHRPVVDRARLHDAAKPVVRVAHADGHETASAGVMRVRPVERRVDTVQRLAVLDRPTACDSIMCPGYALIGVGF